MTTLASSVPAPSLINDAPIPLPPLLRTKWDLNYIMDTSILTTRRWRWEFKSCPTCKGVSFIIPILQFMKPRLDSLYCCPKLHSKGEQIELSSVWWQIPALNITIQVFWNSHISWRCLISHMPPRLMSESLTWSYDGSSLNRRATPFVDQASSATRYEVPCCRLLWTGWEDCKTLWHKLQQFCNSGKEMGVHFSSVTIKYKILCRMLSGVKR